MDQSMEDRKSDDKPKLQLEASRDGSGGGKTTVSSKADGDSDSIINLATEEARRLGHNFVGTEMLLVALIRCSSGIAPRVLEELGVSAKDARAEMEAIIGRGSGFAAVEIPFTPRAKRVLELSWDEAKQLGHIHIGTEHLLQGIAREGEGVASRILEKLGVASDSIRKQVQQHLLKQELSND